MTKTLTKAEILAVPLATEAVDVPEWGGTVKVRVMSGLERDQFDRVVASKSNVDGKVTDPSGFKSLLVRLTVCNDDGELLFSQDDVSELDGTNGSALERVAFAAMAINGLSPNGVKGMEENSSAALNASSGSD